MIAASGHSWSPQRQNGPLDAITGAVRADRATSASPSTGPGYVLVHEFELLVATYDGEHGDREYPSATPADGTGRHFWAPYWSK